MHYSVFTELSMASTLVRMPKSPLSKQHDLHRKSGMFSQQSNAVFLVSWNAKCGWDHRNSHGFQLDHCCESSISLAISLPMHHQGHHGESYRYLHYGHLSLCRVGHLFLQSGDASGDGRWRYLFVYTKGELTVVPFRHSQPSSVESCRSVTLSQAVLCDPDFW